MRHHHVIVVLAQVALDDVGKQFGVVVVYLQVYLSFIPQGLQKRIVNQALVRAEFVGNEQDAHFPIASSRHVISFSLHREDKASFAQLAVSLFNGIPGQIVVGTHFTD